MRQIKTKLTAAAYALGGVNWPRLFLFYDRDGTGDIDLAEFRSLIRKDAKVTAKMLSDEMLEHLFWIVDEDKSGRVAYREFLSWLELENELARDAAFPASATDAPAHRSVAAEPAASESSSPSDAIANLKARAGNLDPSARPRAEGNAGSGDAESAAAIVIQRKVRGRLERDRENMADEPVRSAHSAADAAAGSPVHGKSPQAAEEKIRTPVHVEEAPDFGKGTAAIETEMDEHLRSLEAEADATARAATEIQRCTRGHLARRNGNGGTGSSRDPDSLAQSGDQVVEHSVEGHVENCAEGQVAEHGAEVQVAEHDAQGQVAEQGAEAPDDDADPGSPSAAEAVAVLESELNRTKPPSPSAIRPGSPRHGPVPASLPGRGILSQGPGRPPPAAKSRTSSVASSAKAKGHPPTAVVRSRSGSNASAASGAAAGAAGSRRSSSSSSAQR